MPGKNNWVITCNPQVGKWKCFQCYTLNQMGPMFSLSEFFSVQILLNRAAAFCEEKMLHIEAHKDGSGQNIDVKG